MNSSKSFSYKSVLRIECYCFLQKEKNITYRKARFFTAQDREKEKSASTASLLFQHSVGKLPRGLIFAGGSPLPQAWEEKTLFCSSVAMSDSCSISSGLSLCSIISVWINNTWLYHSLVVPKSRYLMSLDDVDVRLCLVHIFFEIVDHPEASRTYIERFLKRPELDEP